MPDDITTDLGTIPAPSNPGSVVYTNPTTGTKVYVNPTTKEIRGLSVYNREVSKIMEGAMQC